MNDRIKDTFDTIHAEEELKNSTKEFLAYKTKQYKTYKNPLYKQVVPVMVCAMLLLTGFGGYRAYFTQLFVISIDINPSIELSINRFDKVISAKGYNEDGLELEKALNIRFMNYADALEEIVNNENVAECLARDEMLSVTVAGGDEENSSKVLKNVEDTLPRQENVHCHMGNSEEVSEAHAAGLSVGKYRAFLELQKLNPDITTDDIEGLTMRQIRDMINELQGDTDSSNLDETTGNHHGYGNGNGNGHRHGAEH